MRRNALVTRLEQHLALTPDERTALEEVSRREIRLKPGAVLMAQDKPNDQLFVVQQGWVHSARSSGSIMRATWSAPRRSPGALRRTPSPRSATASYRR